jgi:glycosidase
MTALFFWMDMKKLTAFLVVTSLLFGCVPAPATAPQTTPTVDTVQTSDAPLETDSSPWWKDAIFYEIFVRSFSDSDGDGIGDFNGIAQKLDYLQELGINAIWLMPIHPSPSYHGYDVINYYAVNPQYGSMDDFKNLLNEAHQRDIKIIIDQVLNHTSSQHPFFMDANSSPDSQYRDWYVWSGTSSGNYWHEGNGGFYYGYFWGGMPDLNYLNPEVTQQMYDMTSYWLNDIGIDGFRIDAAKHLIEEGTQIENTEATHEWFKEYYTFYKSEDPNAYTVGEIYGAGAFIATKYAEQMDHIFNFELASGIVNSVSGESNTGINGAWNFTLKDITTGDYATFLTNHDQNRVMSVLNGNEQKAKLAAVMLLTSPGTPFIYYGEEIGMQGKKPDEDIRLPMQWSTEVNAGFTSGTPWRAPDPKYVDVNVAGQDTDANSLLTLYRTLAKLRHEHAVLRNGSLTLLDTENTGVYAVIRSDGGENIMILINLKGTPISDYSLSMKEKLLPNSTLTPSSLLDATTAAPLTVTGGIFKEYKPLSELPPYQAYIFELK